MFPNRSYSLSPRTSALWAAETLVCFGLCYVVLYKVLDQLTATAFDHAIVYALTFGLMALVIGTDQTQVRRQWRRLLSRTLVAAVLLLPIVWVIDNMTPLAPLGLRAEFGAYELMVWIVVIFAIQVLFGVMLQSTLFGRRIVVLGTSAATAWIRNGCGVAYDVHGTAAMNMTGAVRPARPIWAVVADADTVNALPSETRHECTRRGIRVLADSAFLETCLHRLDVSTLAPGQIVPDERRGQLFALGTRAFDIAFAVLMLLATLPVTLAAACAIKLEDGGPIFYGQNRVGLHGAEFTVFKFRSMRVDAEARGPVWAQQRDPRVTRIGGLLRRTRIDELPQLLNILRGEMSVIGPRPERPHFVRQLIEAIPCYADRAAVKPGLTGWAQVNYPYGASIDDARAKLSYDLYYVKHRNLLLSLMTLFATVRVVLFQDGAR